MVAVTDVNGVAVLTTTGTKKGSVSLVLCVDSVTGAGLTYDPTENAITCTFL